MLEVQFVDCKVHIFFLDSLPASVLGILACFSGQLSNVFLSSICDCLCGIAANSLSAVVFCNPHDCSDR
jgi:hypothetical protein